MKPGCNLPKRGCVITTNTATRRIGYDAGRSPHLATTIPALQLVRLDIVKRSAQPRSWPELRTPKGERRTMTRHMTGTREEADRTARAAQGGEGAWMKFWGHRDFPGGP
jgi:hypothetical protein